MRTIGGVRRWVSDLLWFFYPELCPGCKKAAARAKACFCMRCESQLLPADMCFAPENEFTERLWGRIPLQSGAALYFFQRRSPLQRALHRLKYHRQAHIGLQLGRLLGAQLKRSPLFRSVEAIVPVPLHPDKEQLRGYNQSALIASGISDTMGIPALNSALERRRFSESQTRKRRMERFEDTEEVFALAQPEAVADKHILLVDDVLTTGATLEACGRALLSAPNVRLSMATVAIATTNKMR